MWRLARPRSSTIRRCPAPDGGVLHTTLRASVQVNQCSAGDSAAYVRKAQNLDDVVVVSSLRTATCKVCTLVHTAFAG